MRKKLLVSIMIFVKEINSTGFSMWVQVRDEEGPLFGMLEFPGGKIELGETPLEACDREVLEEVGIDISKVSEKVMFKLQPYSFNNKDILLYVFVSEFDQMPKEKGQWLQIKYAEKSDYLKGKIPEINHVIIDELAVYLEKLYLNDSLGNLWTQLKP